MDKKWFGIALILSVGISFYFMLSAVNLHSEEEKIPEPEGALKVQEKGLSQKVLSEEDEKRLLERFIFISIPEVFESLDRAPVKFYHDKHTKALEPEGCDLCHPKDEQSNFTFTYPKERDEDDREALINAFHDECTGCHSQRAEEGKKTGPQTCGECHVVEPEYLIREYLPILPEYYEPLRDTYHEECIACHQEPAKLAEDAGKLEWKNFYVKQQQKLETEWPKVVFDYFLHDTHDQALEEKCELCHYLSPEAEEKLAAEGKDPSCQDWLKERDPERDLTEEKMAHPVCINCHLTKKDEGKDAGPFYCRQCHTGIIRTAEEMAEVPRKECDQEDKILITIEEGARMEGVAFDHKLHQTNTRGCQECHHDTLQACKVCHTLEGSEEGDFIALAESYHDETSTWSCVGCHQSEKEKAECAGCHHLLKSGLIESSCTTCHSGTLDTLKAESRLEPPKSLFPKELKDEMEIILIENEYGPSKMPHFNIAKRLTEISDESSLARYFHRDQTTICSGCHHFGPVEKGTNLPLCSTCHTVRKEPHKSVPTLLGAYHQQCLGCHKQMGGAEEEKPQSCTGCHEEKAKK